MYPIRNTARQSQGVIGYLFAILTADPSNPNRVLICFLPNPNSRALTGAGFLMQNFRSAKNAKIQRSRLPHHPSGTPNYSIAETRWTLPGKQLLRPQHHLTR